MGVGILAEEVAEVQQVQGHLGIAPQMDGREVRVDVHAQDEIAAARQRRQRDELADLVDVLDQFLQRDLAADDLVALNVEGVGILQRDGEAAREVAGAVELDLDEPELRGGMDAARRGEREGGVGVRVLDEQALEQVDAAELRAVELVVGRLVGRAGVGAEDAEVERRRRADGVLHAEGRAGSAGGVA